MINIKEHARKLMKDWRKNGFNGVRVSIEDETTDEPEEGEQTVEEKAEFDRNYSIFTVEPRFPVRFDEDSPYVKVVNTEDQFWGDFEKMLQIEFGDDVKINFYSGCNEFEIIREKQ